MWRWAIAAAVGILITVLMASLIRYRSSRRRLLAVLAAVRAEYVAQFPIAIVSTESRACLATEFASEHIIRIGGFLDPACLQALRLEARQCIPQMIPSFIPTHKKGWTLSYEQIHRQAPVCLSFYHSPRVHDWVSEIVGMRVYPTPDGDQSSLSLLCYKDPGDHINWHYDHNFYRGRHFTVLLSLFNESLEGGLSHSSLMRRRADSTDETMDTSPNSLVVFEGARVLHRATPTARGDLRIMLSMTYCADPQTSWPGEFARRIKDTAFYGIRALWD